MQPRVSGRQTRNRGLTVADKSLKARRHRTGCIGWLRADRRAGEDMSAQSKADTEQPDLRRTELKADDAGERQELIAIYVASGLRPKYRRLCVQVVGRARWPAAASQAACRSPKPRVCRGPAPHVPRTTRLPVLTMT